LALDTDPDFGYSDAMLEAATDGGSVVSADISPIVTERAHRSQAYGYRPRQISFRTGPLLAGWPDSAPYDLVVSLCPFGWLPNSWIRQCQPGAAVP